MSSILKALRKLEEEKRGGDLGTPDLRVDQGQSATKPGPLVPLAVGIVFGAVVVGLFFLWPAGSRQERDVVEKVTLAPVAPAALKDSSLPPVDNDKQVIPETTSAQQQTPLAAPVPGDDPIASTANEHLSNGIAHELGTVPVVSPKPARKSVKTEKLDTGEPVTTASAVGGPKLPPQEDLSLPGGVHLVVSEIFYQDAVNSLAVVNDLPVMVGSHIDSAVITEIRADRVLFEIDGKVYPVSVTPP